jgi:hypothetical protein
VIRSTEKWQVEGGQEGGLWRWACYEMETDIWRVTLKMMLGSSDCTVLPSLYSLYILQILNTRHFRFFYSLYIFFRNSRVAVQFLLYLHISSGSYT